MKPLQYSKLNPSIASSLFELAQTLLYVHLIVNQSNNGESLSHGRSSKPKRHNAKLCPFPVRQQIVTTLANGDSVRAIARALRSATTP